MQNWLMDHWWWLVKNYGRLMVNNGWTVNHYWWLMIDNWGTIKYDRSTVYNNIGSVINLWWWMVDDRWSMNDYGVLFVCFLCNLLCLVIFHRETMTFVKFRSCFCFVFAPCERNMLSSNAMPFSPWLRLFVTSLALHSGPCVPLFFFSLFLRRYLGFSISHVMNTSAVSVIICMWYMIQVSHVMHSRSV